MRVERDHSRMRELSSLFQTGNHEAGVVSLAMAISTDQLQHPNIQNIDGDSADSEVVG